MIGESPPPSKQLTPNKKIREIPRTQLLWFEKTLQSANKKITETYEDPSNVYFNLSKILISVSIWKLYLHQSHKDI